MNFFFKRLGTLCNVLGLIDLIILLIAYQFMLRYLTECVTVCASVGTAIYQYMNGAQVVLLVFEKRREKMGKLENRKKKADNQIQYWPILFFFVKW